MDRHRSQWCSPSPAGNSRRPDQELGIPLQADHAELPQGHEHPFYVPGEGKPLRENALDEVRDLLLVKVRRGRLADLRQPDIQNDGVHGIHGGRQLGTS